MTLIQLRLHGRVLPLVGVAGGVEPTLVHHDVGLVGLDAVRVRDLEAVAHVSCRIGRALGRDARLLVAVDLGLGEGVGVLLAILVLRGQSLLAERPAVGLGELVGLDILDGAAVDGAAKGHAHGARALMVDVVLVVPSLGALDRDGGSALVVDREHAVTLGLDAGVVALGGAGLAHLIGVRDTVRVACDKVLPGVRPTGFVREVSLGDDLLGVVLAGRELNELHMHGRVRSDLGLARCSEPALVHGDARLRFLDLVLVCEGEGPGDVAVLLGGALGLEVRDVVLGIVAGQGFAKRVGVGVAIRIGGVEIVAAVILPAVGGGELEGADLLGGIHGARLTEHLDGDGVRTDLVGVVMVVPGLRCADGHFGQALVHQGEAALAVALRRLRGEALGDFGLLDLVRKGLARLVARDELVPGIRPVVVLGQRDGVALGGEGLAAVGALEQLRLYRGMFALVGVAGGVQPLLAHGDARVLVLGLVAVRGAQDDGRVAERVGLAGLGRVRDLVAVGDILLEDAVGVGVAVRVLGGKPGLGEGPAVGLGELVVLREGRVDLAVHRTHERERRGIGAKPIEVVDVVPDLLALDGKSGLAGVRHGPGVAVMGGARLVAGRHLDLGDGVRDLLAVQGLLCEAVEARAPGVVLRELGDLALDRDRLAVNGLVELDLNGTVLAGLRGSVGVEPVLIHADRGLLEERVGVRHLVGPGLVAVVVGLGGELVDLGGVAVDRALAHGVGAGVAGGVGQLELVPEGRPVVGGVQLLGVDDLVIRAGRLAHELDRDGVRANLVGVVGVVPGLAHAQLADGVAAVGEDPGVALAHGVALLRVARGDGVLDLLDLVLIARAVGIAVDVLLWQAGPVVGPLVRGVELDGVPIGDPLAAVLGLVELRLDAQLAVRGIGLGVAVRVEPLLGHAHAVDDGLELAVEGTRMGLGGSGNVVADVGTARIAVREVDVRIGGERARDRLSDVDRRAAAGVVEVEEHEAGVVIDLAAAGLLAVDDEARAGDSDGALALHIDVDNHRALALGVHAVDDQLVADAVELGGRHGSVGAALLGAVGQRGAVALDLLGHAHVGDGRHGGGAGERILVHDVDVDEGRGRGVGVLDEVLRGVALASVDGEAAPVVHGLELVVVAYDEGAVGTAVEVARRVVELLDVGQAVVVVDVEEVVAQAEVVPAVERLREDVAVDVAVVRRLVERGDVEVARNAEHGLGLRVTELAELARGGEGVLDRVNRVGVVAILTRDEARGARGRALFGDGPRLRLARLSGGIGVLNERGHGRRGVGGLISSCRIGGIAGVGAGGCGGLVGALRLRLDRRVGLKRHGGRRRGGPVPFSAAASSSATARPAFAGHSETTIITDIAMA